MTQQKRHLRTMCVPTPSPTKTNTEQNLQTNDMHYFCIIPVYQVLALKVFTYYASIRKVLPLFLSFSLSHSEPLSLTLPGP